MTHKARKRFGQNFLHDTGVIQSIVNAIYPRKEDNLIEIGPGLGALTTQLLPLAESMQVVELDRDVIPHLEQACSGLGELKITQADALNFDFTSLMVADKKLRIVGNLPYNISTPLLFHLMAYAAQIQDMHFMLQKEVVDRMSAAPGNKHYGRLTIMLQYFCQVDKLFDVPPEAFDPAPKVDSAVVRLTPYSVLPIQVDNIETYAMVVTKSFAHRRKTLRNNLKNLLTSDQIEALGINPSSRAETLTQQQFALLSNALDAFQVQQAKS